MNLNKNNIWDLHWKGNKFNIIEQRIQEYKERLGYQKLLKSVDEINEIGSVLEVGAGKASISKLMRLQGWHTVALDNNKRIVKNNSNAVDEYILGDIFDLPFEDNSFDLVMSCGLLEHFTIEDLEIILLEMKRVGNCVVAWLPICGLAFKTLWAFRNITGANVYSETYHYGTKKIQEIFSMLGFFNIKVGVVSFGFVFKYLFVYAVSRQNNELSYK